MTPTVLVTGGMGCIGAWVLRHLVERGLGAVNFDLSENRARIDLLLSREEQERIRFVRGDLTDPEEVARAVGEHGVSHVIHLAALQIPFCRADPVLGSRVNVTGTVNVFEAARAAGIRHLAYASSIAVYGPRGDYAAAIVGDDAPKRPRTLYGVYKVANEGTARVYWQDHGISSVALRPYTVYGVGRDQGLTSEPTKAMQAAAAGRSYHIAFGGRMQFQWASDVARAFVEVALDSIEGAHAFDLGGEPVAVEEVARIIARLRPGVEVTVAEDALPFPDGFDDAPLRAAYPELQWTDLETGIERTIRRFEEARGA